MDTKLKCPFCKSDRFIRHSEEEVEMIDSGDCITDDLVGGLAEYTYKCAKCKKDVTEEELVR